MASLQQIISVGIALQFMLPSSFAAMKNQNLVTKVDKEAILCNSSVCISHDDSTSSKSRVFRVLARQFEPYTISITSTDGSGPNITGGIELKFMEVLTKKFDVVLSIETNDSFKSILSRRELVIDLNTYDIDR